MSMQYLLFLFKCSIIIIVMHLHHYKNKRGEISVNDEALNDAFSKMRDIVENLRGFPAFSIIMSALVIFMVFICVFAIFRTAKEEKRIEDLRWDKVSDYMELVDCDTGERFQLSADEVIIGRHGAADIRFPDMSVSRYHAVLCVSNGVWRVIDLGSKSGTFVNGQKVQEQIALNDHDEIRFGTKAAVIRRRRV